MNDDRNTTPGGESPELVYLRETPVEVIVGNHLFVLLQLAALRLGETPPQLGAAALVIDASAAVLDASGARLGDDADIYRSALAEVQRAYVRASNAVSDAGDGGASSSGI